MAIYAIGDIQGCYAEFQKLLTYIDFQKDRDILWLTGDLVNRGPQSLEVLRFVKSLGQQVIAVLGNHDLHLLAVASGSGKLGKEDTLDPILAAPDADDLLTWLRHRPLCHYDAELSSLLIHAGIPPQWNIETTIRCAREVEQVLQSDAYADFFVNMYGNSPNIWAESLSGWDRLRFITNSLTRLRYAQVDGRFCLNAKGSVGTQPSGCIPWFKIKNRLSLATTIIFGHWSTLGYYCSENVIGLDSGCLWGGALTAVRLSTNQQQTPQMYHVPCQGERTPILG